jgi:circadian clock protein KaiB
MSLPERHVTLAEHKLTRQRFEEALVALKSEEYRLTLFVSGASEPSANAIANVRQICDAYLPERHHLKIVDLHQEPELAKQYHVLATPTLVVDQPLPLRMLVGDMSNHPRILIALDLLPGPPDEADGAAIVESQGGS